MSVGQTAFRAAIFDPDLAVPAGLVDPLGRAAGKRFDVYRNGVVATLSSALAEAFPVIRKLLGDNNFSIMAGSFVRAYPPRSPLLALYGADLPGFLEEFEPVRKLGYLPDVARLEQAMRRSYHAADVKPANANVLSGMSPDSLAAVRFTFAPTMQLVQSKWPIVAIWRFNMEDGPSPAMAADSALITRPEFDPSLTRLSPAEHVFVAALTEGMPLGAAVETAAAADNDFDLTPTLGALVSGGAITAIIEE